MFNEALGTEDVVIVAETDTDDEDARAVIAEAIRDHLTRNSDVAVRTVYLVPSRWLIKTSSGKVARSANREKYLREIAAS